MQEVGHEPRNGACCSALRRTEARLAAHGRICRKELQRAAVCTGGNRASGSRSTPMNRTVDQRSADQFGALACVLPVNMMSAMAVLRVLRHRFDRSLLAQMMNT